MTKRQGLALPFLLAALLHAGVALAQLPTVELNAGMYLIRAEVAADFASRARGLMHREALAPNAGMLFVFDAPGPQCMWMKNTRIPLSVAFVDAAGAIVSIHDMQPHTLDSHMSRGPALYAIETNHGWFAERRIGPGAKVTGLPRKRP